MFVIGLAFYLLGDDFWIFSGVCYTLRPESNRTTITMRAMTSSSHMMAPRLKTKPSSQSMISIAATTKSKSRAPIFKNLTYP